MTCEVELTELEQQSIAVIRDHVAIDNIAAFLGDAFSEVLALIERQELTPTGPPFGRYRPTADGGFDVDAGFPIRGGVTPQGRVEASTLPGGATAHALHVGSYGTVGAAYRAIPDWLADNSCVATAEPWESYLDGPESANPRTEVFWPYERARSAKQAEPR